MGGRPSLQPLICLRCRLNAAGPQTFCCYTVSTGRPSDISGTLTGFGLWSGLSHLTPHTHTLHSAPPCSAGVCEEDPARYFKVIPCRNLTFRILWEFWWPQFFSGLPSEVSIHHTLYTASECVCMSVNDRSLHNASDSSQQAMPETSRIFHIYCFSSTPMFFITGMKPALRYKQRKLNAL